MARQKTVWSTNAKLVKAWTRQEYQEGRTPNGNLSFYRSELYSYRMMIANIVSVNEHQKVVLVEPYRPSPSHTTSAHIMMTKQIAHLTHPEYPMITCVFLTPHHDENLRWFLDELRRTRFAFDNSRSGWGRHYLDVNNNVYNELVKYCKIFDLKVPMTLGLYLNPNYKWIQRRFWGNVFIPRWLADKRESNSIVPKDVLRTKNAEVRRLIVEHVGIERICYALNAQVIDKQGNYELLLLDLGDGRRRPFLKMLNPSVPECWHVEGVHILCNTVQEALNYRRYGDSILKWSRDFTRYIDDSVENWKPEYLT